MHTVQNTLYVMTPNAYVHLENDTLRIDVEREKKLQVPLHHLGSVVCFGNIMVSPALVHRLADEGKILKILSAHLADDKLIFDRVIPEGKKEMTWESYLRGKK